MILRPHPGLRVTRHVLGNEGASLLVIDDVVADPERLLRRAVAVDFTPQGEYFPGIRARAPASYDLFLARLLQPWLADVFGLPAQGRLAFPMCHYSLVTRMPEQLQFRQRVPHVDSTQGNGLATVHYLFRGDWGGTAFYRHRSTGFEVIDDARRETYLRRLDSEAGGPAAPASAYIGGDTALFERIAAVDGVFNRMLVYRRNSLHSGTIDNQRIPPPDPLQGRLSINSFIDVLA